MNNKNVGGQHARIWNRKLDINKKLQPLVAVNVSNMWTAFVEGPLTGSEGL